MTTTLISQPVRPGVPAAATPRLGGAGGGDDGGLGKAAEAFEAVILRQLMASMRQAKLGDDIFGSSATDNFREMADARTADSIAAMRQFGIAAMVEAQFRGRAAAASGALQ
ncbi:rod-binding protein [Sphingopyxis indica]|uniref:Flagellar protein FlgJ n=1 Tax=Sphingopyxis indica TaxID=436663 RepID=A0A239JEB7_9SPHN|nr:rod-binding protein [Sphingopyxis indica]WOF43595.1 rod-binding protein [Sphingopyxis indica]SNT03778.1 flagellar protein FlgJ [Sphingopyxis indica]